MPHLRNFVDSREAYERAEYDIYMAQLSMSIKGEHMFIEPENEPESRVKDGDWEEFEAYLDGTFSGIG